MGSKLNDFVQAQLEDDSSLAGDQRAALFHFTQVQFGERLTLAENQRKALQAFWMYEEKEFLPIAQDLERIFNPIFSHHSTGSRRTDAYLDTYLAAKQAQRSNQQLILHLNQEINIGIVYEGSNKSCAKYARDVAKELLHLLKAIEFDGEGEAEKASCMVAQLAMSDAAKLMQLLETGCASRVLVLHRLIESLLASQESDARIHQDARSLHN
jgi:hypothetical protein